MTCPADWQEFSWAHGGSKSGLRARVNVVGNILGSAEKYPRMSATNTEGRHGYTVYEVMIVALIIVLSTVTLVSLFQIQSLQNQINGLRQIGLSVVSGKVTTSTDNLANVPYASTIMFDAGFNHKVNSTIILQNYTTYLIDGLGYGVTIEFSDKTLCYVGTFVPKGAFVVHSFYCQRPTVY